MDKLNWHIISSSRSNGRDNMVTDATLFQAAEDGHLKNPTVRIYGWDNHCISLGHSQDPEKELYVDTCLDHGVEFVKRPTGGGIVIHNPQEITYSLISQKGWIPYLDLIGSFIYISEAIIEGLQLLGICTEISNGRNKGFARYCNIYPATHEIVYNSKKIVGSAQKRGRKAILQQGSIIVDKRYIEPKFYIRGYSDKFESKSTSISEVMGRTPSFKELQEALVEGFKRKFRTVTI